MTVAPSQNPDNGKPLTVQIREAERRLQNRRQVIARDGATLAQNLRRQMSKPVTLLCAVGIGFLLGELTKPQAHKLRGAAGKSRVVEASPLAIALNLATSIRSLYTALPVVWLMKNFNQRPASAKAPDARRAGPARPSPSAVANASRPGKPDFPASAPLKTVPAHEKSPLYVAYRTE